MKSQKKIEEMQTVDTKQSKLADTLDAHALSRRNFLKTTAAATAALSLGPFFLRTLSAAENSGKTGWKMAPQRTEFNKDAIVLKCACYYPNAGDIGNGIHWETFNFLENEFNGRLKFERYFGQSLHSLTDGFKALRAGLSHIAQAYPLNNQGAFDLTMGDGLPFLYNNVAVATQTMESMYPKWFKPEFERQGIYLGWIPFFDVQGIICKKPIRKMEDLKGQRIMGFGGAVLRDTLIGLGATPVFTSAPDTFIALQRGVVDGVAWAAGSIIPWRFHEVAKYLTITGLSCTAINYGVNKEKFHSLPPDFQKELYFKMRLAGNHMSEGYTKLEDRGYAELREKGVEIIQLEPDEKARWHAVGDTVWEKFIVANEKKGLNAREFAKDFKATAAKYNAMSIPEIREYVQNPQNMIHGIIDGF